MKNTANVLILFIIALLTWFDAQSLCKAQEISRPGKTAINLPMDDGVTLSTTVFLPGGKKKCPAVLVRTPYDKNAEEWMGKAFKMFGIAVILQDVRGRYQSEGSFYPFINERADGLATLRWIRSQPWSDGTVAGWGGSYVGFTQWAISDSLDFLTLLVTGARLYDFVYPGGLFSLQSAFEWGLRNAGQKPVTVPAEKIRAAEKMLPLGIADDSTTGDIGFVNDWLAHETFDTYWQKMDFRGITRAPLISMAGWYDIFLISQIEDFQALPDAAGSGRRLIIGPWYHGTPGEQNDYGGLKKTGKPSKIFIYVKNHLNGKKNKLTSPLKDAVYNLFIMERNEYIGSDVWPPEETTMVPYYIGPSGYLDMKPVDKNGYLSYEYSPADPYPSRGGTALGEGVGPARQNENVTRKDQLVFETTIIEDPLILLGPVTATLWLASDAATTDFIVGLQDVFPDGRIINIQEGGARVKPSKDQPEKTEISVWATGYQINPGHTLRVFISSSWFPRYNRNLNIEVPAFTAVEMTDANQKVYYGPGTPSSISLPVYSINQTKKRSLK